MGNKKVICIFGATGFVGSSLLIELCKFEYEIRIFTRRRIYKLPSNVIQFNGSVLCESNLLRFLNNCSLIYNCIGSYTNDNNINYLLPDKIINAISKITNKNKVHFVQLSSVGVYGSFQSSVITQISENSKCSPANKYEISKLEADKLIISKSKSHNFTYTIVRPTNVVGQNMKNHSFGELISIIKKWYFFKIGFKKTIVNYLHIDDLVSSLILVGCNELAKNQIFIISNDCYIDELIMSVRIKNKFPIISYPKIIVIFLFLLLKNFINIPLTMNRINALSNLTTYSSNKIYRLLNFLPNRNIDYIVNDFISKDYYK